MYIKLTPELTQQLKSAKEGDRIRVCFDIYGTRVVHVFSIQRSQPAESVYNNTKPEEDWTRDVKLFYEEGLTRYIYIQRNEEQAYLSVRNTSVHSAIFEKGPNA